MAAVGFRLDGFSVIPLDCQQIGHGSSLFEGVGGRFFFGGIKALLTLANHHAVTGRSDRGFPAQRHRWRPALSFPLAAGATALAEGRIRFGFALLSGLFERNRNGARTHNRRPTPETR